MIAEPVANKKVMSLYAAIAKQSEEMLLAAQKGDWDLLCESEKKCSALIEDLKHLKPFCLKLSADEKQEHIAYLKKILADDAAIRDITQPRIAKLEQFLRAANNQHRLKNSYGSR